MSAHLTIFGCATPALVRNVVIAVLATAFFNLTKSIQTSHRQKFQLTPEVT